MSLIDLKGKSSVIMILYPFYIVFISHFLQYNYNVFRFRPKDVMNIFFKKWTESCVDVIMTSFCLLCGLQQMFSVLPLSFGMKNDFRSCEI